MQLTQALNLAVLSAALALAACADTNPVKAVGPDTYQISHTQSKTAPTANIISGLTMLGQQKCAADNNAPFQKLSDAVTPGTRTQTVTVIFQCKPSLIGSKFTASMANQYPTAQISYTAPLKAIVPPTTQKPGQ